MAVIINVDLKINGTIEGDEKERQRIYKIFVQRLALLCEKFNLKLTEGEAFGEVME